MHPCRVSVASLCWWSIEQRVQPSTETEQLICTGTTSTESPFLHFVAVCHWLECLPMRASSPEDTRVLCASGNSTRKRKPTIGFLERKATTTHLTHGCSWRTRYVAMVCHLYAPWKHTTVPFHAVRGERGDNDPWSSHCKCVQHCTVATKSGMSRSIPVLVW